MPVQVWLLNIKYVYSFSYKQTLALFLLYYHVISHTYYEEIIGIS